MLPRKKKYNEWLKSKVPKLPRTTKHYLHSYERDKDQSDSNEDDNDGNVNVSGDGNGDGSSSRQHSSESSSDSSDNDDSSTSDQNSEISEPTNADSNDSLTRSDDEADEGSTSQTEADHGMNPAILPRQPKKRDELDLPLYPGLSTTQFDCYLMCLHFMMRHGLTKVALLDLLMLINAIFGKEVIKPSACIFEQLFQGSFEMEFHFYCPTCKAYLGQSLDFDKENQNVECSNCKNVCKLNDKMNGGHFLIYISVAQQLKSMFESSPDVWDLLKYRFTRQTDDDCCDIFDGSLYKQFSAEGEILSDPKNVSITCNSDGSPVFKHTNNSLWPIQFRVNEMPPDVRFGKSNTMVCGLWFGKEEPEMSTFFTPFLKETYQLHREGFQWTDPKGDIITSRVATLNCVFDSVARPKGQGTRQYNAYWGCNFCFHPGAMVTGHRHPRYIINSAPSICMTDQLEFLYRVTRKNQKIKDRVVLETFDVCDRSDEDMREQMKRIAAGGEEERGVHTLSPFFPLFWFNLVFGFAVDWMHCVLIGVCKFVTIELFLNSENHKEDFYVGLKVTDINERLLNITPPSSVSWFPRSLKEKAKWKANEWRLWLLYYSLPCLQGILKPPFLQHHCLLVTAIFIMLQDRITKSDLKLAAHCLMLYVRDFQKLYGEKNMSFNVHLLLHLPKCVEALGPLWSFSAFPFESGNGFLVRLVKGTRSVVGQIAKKYIMCACVPEVLPLYNVSESAIEYCSDIMSYPLAKVSRKISNVTLLDLPVSIPLSGEEERAISAAGCDTSPFTYERLIKDGVKYHALCYRKQGKKSNDSFVKTTNGEYFALRRILAVPTRNSSNVLVLVRQINLLTNSSVVRHSCGASAPHIRVCAPNVYGPLSVIDCSLIKQKVVKIDVGLCDKGIMYVADLPKFYEKD